MISIHALVQELDKHYFSLVSYDFKKQAYEVVSNSVTNWYGWYQFKK